MHSLFKIPPRRSELLELREEVKQLRRDVNRLSELLARMPKPPEFDWHRTSAPDLDAPLPEQQSPAPSLLELLAQA